MAGPGHDQKNDDIRRIVRELKDKPGALLPILHAVQEERGYVPPEAVSVIAHELNLTRAEVHGVVSFYHDFRTTPPGRHVLRICQAESCQATGSDALTRHACEQLGIPLHETTPDQEFTMQPVYCLGNCACSPSVMLDGELLGRVTEDRLREILKEARSR